MKSKRSVHIFTDGACSNNPGVGGWSSISYNGIEKVIMSGYDDNTTNNRMELKGFISGLEMAINILSCDNEIDDITIFTDSKYIENPINCKWIEMWPMKGFKNIKNVDLWIRVIELISMVNVKVVWIPRESNKEADQIAKNARDGLYGRRATMIVY